jgi:SAM-dependent methyltransferase
MRKIVYFEGADRLVYLHAKATPEFWEGHWRAEGKAPPPSEDDEVVRVTRRYLPAGSKVLEGGCGRADKVHSLDVAGFKATGIDFAPDAVRQAAVDYPGIDVQHGDVRALAFPEATFDGYWSIGVIEHFWSGYAPILAEAARVLRPGGFLFLTAPWFSPMRRRKSQRGEYVRTAFTAEPEDFYQFALGRDEVTRALASHGFELVRWAGTASEMSLREDFPARRSQVKWLFDSRGGFFKRVFRRVLTKTLDPYCGHSFMAIARRKSAA